MSKSSSRSRLFHDNVDFKQQKLGFCVDALSERNSLSNNDLSNNLFLNFSAERDNDVNLHRSKNNSMFKQPKKQQSAQVVTSSIFQQANSSISLEHAHNHVINEAQVQNNSFFEQPVVNHEQLHQYNNGSFVQSLSQNYQNNNNIINSYEVPQEHVSSLVFEQETEDDITKQVHNQISSGTVSSQFKIDNELRIVTNTQENVPSYIDDGKLQHKRNRDGKVTNNADDIISFAEDDFEDLLENQNQKNEETTGKNSKKGKLYNGSSFQSSRSLDNDIAIDEIQLVSLEDEEVKKAHLEQSNTIESLDRQLPPLPEEEEDAVSSFSKGKKNKDPNNRPRFSLLEHTISSLNVSSSSSLNNSDELIEGVDVALADVERGVRLLSDENADEDEDLDAYFAGNVSTVSSVAVRTGTDNQVYGAVKVQGDFAQEDEEEIVDSEHQKKSKNKGDTYKSEYDLTEYGDKPNILTIFPEKEVFSSTLKGISSDSEHSEPRLFPMLMHDFGSYWLTYGLAILACILCLYKVYQVQETRDLTSRLNEVSLNNSELNREWLSLVATRQNLSEHASIRDFATNNLHMTSPKTEKEMVISVSSK